MTQKTFSTKYVGDTPGYQIEKGAFIDKTVCGCGLTTFALKNNEDFIIAVPTNRLIENKQAQIPGILKVNCEVTKEQIDQYCKYKRAGQIKIMCTYDSLYRVEHLIGRCRILIDEVQSFFKSYNNKSEADKMRNLYRETLNICEKYKDVVSFVSATPIPIEYFLEWMKELEQVKYNFEYTYKKTPILANVKSPLKCLAEQIIRPIMEEGSVSIADKTFSKCLIFINSISDVATLIKDYEIPTDNFGFYCGDTLVNDAKLAEMNISRITGLWDLKQFSFVTSSGWAGCDFYDKEAMTIVVSNTSKNYTMVDVNTDLMQAVARLRNDDNPNANKYLFIYNQTAFTKSEEDLISWIEENRDDLIDICGDLNGNNIANGTRKRLLKLKDVIEFVYINDNQYLLDVMHFNVMKYQILEVKSKFMKGFDFSMGEDSIFVNLDKKNNSVTYKQVLDKIKAGKELSLEEANSKWVSLINDFYKKYGTYTVNSVYARERLESDNIPDELKTVLKASFKTKTDIPVKDVKKKLQSIYDELGIKRTAKATDLREYADCDIKSTKERGIVSKCMKINMWKAK